LSRTRSWLARLGATGTPVFVVGDKVLNRRRRLRMLKDAIARRAKKGS
jgi:hypothetical protein